LDFFRHFLVFCFSMARLVFFGLSHQPPHFSVFCYIITSFPCFPFAVVVSTAVFSRAGQAFKTSFVHPRRYTDRLPLPSCPPPCFHPCLQQFLRAAPTGDNFFLDCFLSLCWTLRSAFFMSHRIPPFFSLILKFFSFFACIFPFYLLPPSSRPVRYFF